MLAVVSDIRSNRISNRLVLAGLTTGLIYRLKYEGLLGFISFLAYIAIPVIILYLLFLMRALGAGDIKLFSIISSVSSIKELAYCMAAAFVIGALMSLLKMLYHRSLLQRLMCFASYIMQLCSNRQFEPYSGGVREVENTIHFSIAILLGYIISMGVCY